MKVIRAERLGKITNVERWVGLWAPRTETRGGTSKEDREGAAMRWEEGVALGKKVQEERGQPCPKVLTGKVLTRTKNRALVWQARPLVTRLEHLEWRGEGRPDRSEFGRERQERTFWEYRVQEPL